MFMNLNNLAMKNKSTKLKLAWSSQETLFFQKLSFSPLLKTPLIWYMGGSSPSFLLAKFCLILSTFNHITLHLVVHVFRELDRLHGRFCGNFLSLFHRDPTQIHHYTSVYRTVANRFKVRRGKVDGC
jgi:hypothetical protein